MLSCKSIINQLPKSIESRLNKLSSNKNIFIEASKHYQTALNTCGYDYKLQHKVHENKQTNKNKRKRNILWFNPPYSKNVSTNIGKRFFQLIQKHFPKTHKWHKIFNRNNLKISYSCMPNIRSIINTHNQRIINSNENNNNNRTCNCINKNLCPLGNECLIENVVYEATIKYNENTVEKSKIYIGITEGTFKKRYANHKQSFNNSKYQKQTELSNFYWQLKSKNIESKTTWRILHKCTPYQRTNDKCSLCLNEKLAILKYDKKNILNRRSELVSKCRHRNKHKLCNHKLKT